MFLLKPEEVKPKCHRAILLFSGGFDSTLVALLLRQKNISTVGLSINYSTRPTAEIKICKELAKVVDLEKHIEVNLPFGDVRSYSTEWSYQHTEAWFPHRNLIFFSLAAHFARINDCNLIAAGTRVWDTPDYDDATQSFFERLASVIRYSGFSQLSSELSFFIPLIDSHRLAENALLSSNESRKILEKTWSCWRNGDEPCGECDPCLARKQFFQDLFELGHYESKDG